MQASRRPQRLAQQIQHEISLILSRHMRDPRIGFVTATGVTLSPDYRHACVYVSAMGSEKEKAQAIQTLNRAAGWIRHELGQKIRVKFLPEIVFEIDASQQYGERIDKLLEDMKEK